MKTAILTVIIVSILMLIQYANLKKLKSTKGELMAYQQAERKGWLKGYETQAAIIDKLEREIDKSKSDLSLMAKNLDAASWELSNVRRLLIAVEADRVKWRDECKRYEALASVDGSAVVVCGEDGAQQA